MATPSMNDPVVQNILRMYARDLIEFKDNPQMLQRSQEEARRSLRTLFERAEPGISPIEHMDAINALIQDAPIAFRDDLGFGQIVQGDLPIDPQGAGGFIADIGSGADLQRYQSPTGSVISPGSGDTGGPDIIGGLVPETYRPDAPPPGGPRESVIGLGGLTEQEEARAELEEERGFRGSTFREYMGRKFSPGASPFLRSGLESRFSPLNLMFETREALGKNLADPLSGEARSFQDWLGNIEPGGLTFGELRPTVSAFQNLANQALTRLQGGFDGGGGTAGQTFLQDPENQFQLALRTRLGSIAPFLRRNFADTARERFDNFMVQNPERAGQFLSEFMGKGQRF
jgi:hypothetical protein